MAIKWVDRVPTYANRVRIVPEDGSAPYYATMERADQPTVVGTPINAANLNAMQEASGLTANRTVYVATTGSDATGDGSATAPYATITKALSTIPKNLNGFGATVTIAAGVYAESVRIRGFCGGEIVFTGNSGDSVTVNGIGVYFCQSVRFRNISLTLLENSISIGFYVESSIVYCDTSVTTEVSESHGVSLANGATVYITSLQVSNKSTTAVNCSGSSKIAILTISGANNAVGLRAATGGVITYTTSTLAAITAYATANGGRIFSGAQTNIPVN